LTLPLFAISGATGVGKSTTCKRLAAALRQCNVLDADLWWRTEYWDDPESTAWMYAMHLNVAAYLNRSGRPTIIGGAVHPPRWERIPERASVSTIHYLALVADPGEHERRLIARGGTGPDDPHFEAYFEFNRWLVANAERTEPPMTLLDTTRQRPDETASAARAWVLARLPQ
jgi:2-phosphoglycerate kinase